MYSGLSFVFIFIFFLFAFTVSPRLLKFCAPRTGHLPRLNNLSPLLFNYRWNRPFQPRKCSAVCTWYDTIWRQTKLTHAYSRPITTFTISVTSSIVISDAPMRLLSLRRRQWASLLVRMIDTFWIEIVLIVVHGKSCKILMLSSKLPRCNLCPEYAFLSQVLLVFKCRYDVTKRNGDSGEENAEYAEKALQFNFLKLGCCDPELSPTTFNRFLKSSLI